MLSLTKFEVHTCTNKNFLLVCALYRSVVSLQFYAHITNSGPSKPHTHRLHTHLTSEIVLQCPCLLKENVTIITCQLEMLMRLTAPEHLKNNPYSSPCMYLRFNCSFCSLFVSSITALQDGHTRLVLQVYLGLNTLEFSPIAK